MSNALLIATLQCAVPLRIDEFKHVPWSVLDAKRASLTNIIASEGDNILYKSKRPGQTAKAINTLIDTLAILSFAPGGVKAFGVHWLSVHPEAGKT